MARAWASVLGGAVGMGLPYTLSAGLQAGGGGGTKNYPVATGDAGKFVLDASRVTQPARRGSRSQSGGRGRGEVGCARNEGRKGRS